MNNPKVSIGLPVYNSEPTLIFAVTSILMQTFTDFELIIIDDASTDSTRSILESFQDKRIRIIFDDIHRGLVYRLNQIVEIARGDYLARMDADDIMHPERIRIQLQFLTSNPEIDVLGTDAYVINKSNKIVGYLRAPDDFSPKGVLLHGAFIHPTIMGKRSWFLENPYDPSYYRAEDYELWVRTCVSSKFYNLHKPLLFYRSSDYVKLTKYLTSQVMRADIITERASKILGITETKILINKILMRAFLYTFARTCGLIKFLHWLRIIKSQIKKSEDKQILEQILNYSLITQNIK
jgi:glycosyltransferase involved in cell wall biosynthesis